MFSCSVHKQGSMLPAFDKLKSHACTQLPGLNESMILAIFPNFHDANTSCKWCLNGVRRGKPPKPLRPLTIFPPSDFPVSFFRRYYFLLQQPCIVIPTILQPNLGVPVVLTIFEPRKRWKTTQSNKFCKRTDNNTRNCIVNYSLSSNMVLQNTCRAPPGDLVQHLAADLPNWTFAKLNH